MWKLKPSPRTLKATEKYIASIGRKREELTEEQWNLMVNYVKCRRISIPFFLIFFLVSTALMIANWYLGRKYVKKVIPEQSVKVIFNEQKEQTIISPEEIRNYLSYVNERYFMTGSQYIFAIGFLVIFILNVTLIRMTNRKTHRILLSRSSTASVAV